MITTLTRVAIILALAGLFSSVPAHLQPSIATAKLSKRSPTESSLELTVFPGDGVDAPLTMVEASEFDIEAGGSIDGVDAPLAPLPIADEREGDVEANDLANAEATNGSEENENDIESNYIANGEVADVSEREDAECLLCLVVIKTGYIFVDSCPTCKCKCPLHQSCLEKYIGHGGRNCMICREKYSLDTIKKALTAYEKRIPVEEEEAVRLEVLRANEELQGGTRVYPQSIREEFPVYAMAGGPVPAVSSEERQRMLAEVAERLPELALPIVNAILSVALFSVWIWWVIAVANWNANVDMLNWLAGSFAGLSIATIPVSACTCAIYCPAENGE